MKSAPSYFEFYEGKIFFADIPLYATVPQQDSFVFTDVGVEVEHTDISTLTVGQREAYDRAFK
jgi:hypothetical protein